MPKYKLTWKNGKTEVVSGITIADAFNKKYSPNALQFLDTYEIIKETKEKDNL
jgi:hypothetical protein